MADEPSDPPPSSDAPPTSATATTAAEWAAGRPLSKRAHLIGGLLLPAALALFTMFRLRSFTVDDSFISFRYARNWARGWGLVYNQGEAIEGYTNFLWTIMLGLGVKIGIEPEVLAKVMGAGFCLLAMWAMYGLSNRLQPQGMLPCVSTWLVASTATFAGYAVFGLETSMFAALVLAGTLLMHREEDRQARIPYSGLVFAAAGLTRPEAPLYLGVMMMFLGGDGLVPLKRLFGHEAKDEDEDDEDGNARLDVGRHRPALLLGAIATVAAAAAGLLISGLKLGTTSLYVSAAIALLLIFTQLPKRLFGVRNLIRGTFFLVPVALHLLWRKSFYGRWLPNTLTAKTGNLNQQLHGGISYLEKGLMHEGVVVYLAVFGLAAALVWQKREGLAIAALVLLSGFYVVLVGGDWMPMFRFLAPIFPFLFLLVGFGVRALAEIRHDVLRYGLLFVALVAVGQRSGRLQRDRNGVMRKERDFWLKAAGGTAKWFNDEVEKRGRDKVEGTIAMGDIGRIGYDTDFPVLDLLGLVDPVIAKLPGGYTNKVGKGYRDRFFDVQPRYFILISSDNDCRHPSVPGSRSLYMDSRFRRQYSESGRVDLGKGFHWCIYENNTFTGRKPGVGRRPGNPTLKRPRRPSLGPLKLPLPR